MEMMRTHSLRQINNLGARLLLVLLGLWLGWTLLIDFVVVPTAFRNLRDFFEAGRLGVLLFTKLNSLELSVASLIVSLTALGTLTQPRRLAMLALAILSWSIILIYLVWLTPKLSELTVLWQQAELNGVSGSGNIPDLQQEHQLYHRIYVGLDTVKLVLLASLIGLGMRMEQE
jgi:hypothetical protein